MNKLSTNIFKVKPRIHFLPCMQFANQISDINNINNAIMTNNKTNKKKQSKKIPNL